MFADDLSVDSRFAQKNTDTLLIRKSGIIVMYKKNTDYLTDIPHKSSYKYFGATLDHKKFDSCQTIR